MPPDLPREPAAGCQRRTAGGAGADGGRQPRAARAGVAAACRPGPALQPGAPVDAVVGRAHPAGVPHDPVRSPSLVFVPFRRT